MSTSRTASRLLAGPSPDRGPEPWAAHLARLGPLPRFDGHRDVIASMEQAGLLGRGGAGFPVGRKWRAMAERAGRRATVVANGAEGEPASLKDRVLMASRPHLVIDGAVLAADVVGAGEITFYVGREHGAAMAAMRAALAERRHDIRPVTRLVAAPIGYVAGEATAVVHYLNAGDARPTTTPPRVSERGVAGRPTLVQNVESLACAALIGRFGADWYRLAGRHETRGTALITLSGAVRDSGVHEIELGTTIGEVAGMAGATAGGTGAVLLGGYFGTWAPTTTAWDLPLDPAAMRSAGLTFGCGMVGLLPAGSCGIAATAQIMAFMAKESAGQCGPCLFGLRALADGMGRVAAGDARADDLDRIARWTAQTAGRGACHHPTVPSSWWPARWTCSTRISGTTSGRAAARSPGPAPRLPRMEIRLQVDWIRCDGYGLCGDLVPDLIALDEWRYPILPAAPVDGSRRHEIQRAIDCCPMRALRIDKGDQPPSRRARVLRRLGFPGRAGYTRGG